MAISAQIFCISINLFCCISLAHVSRRDPNMNNRPYVYSSVEWTVDLDDQTLLESVIGIEKSYTDEKLSQSIKSFEENDNDDEVLVHFAIM